MFQLNQKVFCKKFNMRVTVKMVTNNPERGRMYLVSLGVASVWVAENEF